MNATVIWLGGWASDLVCWEPMLRKLAPDCDHRFLDSHAWLDAGPAQAGLTGGPRRLVAAWSLGTLLCHHWMARGLWPGNLALLSLCPVFNFVRGAFGEPVILRMEKKLAADRDSVLRDFWRRMPRSGEIPAAWEQRWLEGARKHGHEELMRGLEFLRNTVVDPGRLALVPARWELLVGDQDKLAPPGNWIRDLPAAAKVTAYAGGHLPFWEIPETIATRISSLIKAET
jgi:pimeloyl-ACP methyl ester carboxylesterase